MWQQFFHYVSGNWRALWASLTYRFRAAGKRRR